VLILMVPRGGFEPPACPLGGDRSIQLSYRGKNREDCTIDGYLIHLFSSKCIDELKEDVFIARKHISRDVSLNNEAVKRLLT
jgi:hypothetical protein